MFSLTIPLDALYTVVINPLLDMWFTHHFPACFSFYWFILFSCFQVSRFSFYKLQVDFCVWFKMWAWFACSFFLFSCCMWPFSVPDTVSWVDDPFLPWLLLDYVSRVPLVLSLLFHCSALPLLRQCHGDFITIDLQYNLKSGREMLPTLSFLDCFSSSGSL